MALLRGFGRRISPGGPLVLNVPFDEQYPHLRHVRCYEEEAARQKLGRTGFRATRQIMEDCWSAFLWRGCADWALETRAMRAACAMMQWNI